MWNKSTKRAKTSPPRRSGAQVPTRCSKTTRAACQHRNLRSIGGGQLRFVLLCYLERGRPHLPQTLSQLLWLLLFRSCLTFSLRFLEAEWAATLSESVALQRNRASSSLSRRAAQKTPPCRTHSRLPVVIRAWQFVIRDFLAKVRQVGWNEAMKIGRTGNWLDCTCTEESCQDLVLCGVDHFDAVSWVACMQLDGLRGRPSNKGKLLEAYSGKTTTCSATSTLRSSCYITAISMGTRSCTQMTSGAIVQCLPLPLNLFHPLCSF